MVKEFLAFYGIGTLTIVSKQSAFFPPAFASLTQHTLLHFNLLNHGVI
jgi:hypothetical protein